VLQYFKERARACTHGYWAMRRLHTEGSFVALDFLSFHIWGCKGKGFFEYVKILRLKKCKIPTSSESLKLGLPYPVISSMAINA
jgi:hypothetical protein